MYAAARDRLGDGRYLAVGDRLDTDVGGRAPRGHRQRARADGQRRPQPRPTAAAPRPTHVADSLAALVLALIF